MHYVIGDVHGCFKELKLLLNKTESKDPDAILDRVEAESAHI